MKKYVSGKSNHVSIPLDGLLTEFNALFPLFID